MAYIDANYEKISILGLIKELGFNPFLQKLRK